MDKSMIDKLRSLEDAAAQEAQRQSEQANKIPRLKPFKVPEPFTAESIYGGTGIDRILTDAYAIYGLTPTVRQLSLIVFGEPVWNEWKDFYNRFHGMPFGIIVNKLNRAAKELGWFDDR